MLSLICLFSSFPGTEAGIPWHPSTWEQGLLGVFLPHNSFCFTPSPARIWASYLPRAERRQQEPSLAQIAIKLIRIEQRLFLSLHTSTGSFFSVQRQPERRSYWLRIEIKGISAVQHHLTYLKFASLPPLTAPVRIYYLTLHLIHS